ncbi:fused signal recognition particle receptor [Fonticula alba]|uniref:Signal recognition particle receptor subunit alpha homolog n=1 Tax=Fonticula alba TaxID=691883 RepID=A0A058ZDN9_FONAL|nr:fused signal recognition particle receptor [Fonticula alba]KCV72043.1 fused signal recognition particle receptor [Fonticula alba]|eukprot:XP_009493621.1 fused signal recognition particle receptor [Fonticula alba]
MFAGDLTPRRTDAERANAGQQANADHALPQDWHAVVDQVNPVIYAHQLLLRCQAEFAQVYEADRASGADTPSADGLPSFEAFTGTFTRLVYDFEDLGPQAAGDGPDAPFSPGPGRRGRRGAPGPVASPARTPGGPTGVADTPSKKKRMAPSKRPNSASAAALDFSDHTGSLAEDGSAPGSPQTPGPPAVDLIGPAQEALLAAARQRRAGRPGDVLDAQDLGTGPAGAAPPASKPASLLNGLFGSFSAALRGDLTEARLDPALEEIRRHLVAKNVPADLAEELVAGARGRLLGTQVGPFQSVQQVIRDALVPSLQRILTPGASTNLLRDILLVRERERRPFVITFCGVNGVGKSTSLSKVAFLLLQNGLRVLVAACDTFRSGAVEQLRRHVDNLSQLSADAGLDAQASLIELFAQGYSSDPAEVARHAIRHARAHAFDVVLVDTAGRMQHNRSLMQGLARLVQINQPDRVLFVGEALVGHDGVDQLREFSRILRQQTAGGGGSANARGIDGIILSKFDTVEDQVGAALALTWTSGQPILFVGVGQHYVDLRKCSADAICAALLS